MTTVKNLPINAIMISNIANAQMQQVAKQYDAGSKGFLTTEEADKLYADYNQDKLATGLDQIEAFLGGPKHPITADYLSGWQALDLQWVANKWKGDFHAAGLGAGNVDVGRQVGTTFDPIHNQPIPTDRTMFLINCDLIDKKVLDNNIVGGAIVIAPKGFPLDASSNLAAAAEIPLTLTTQDGYTTFNRGGGSSFVPEKKFLAAAVETKDLKSLADTSGGLSFFVRLNTNDGKTVYLNRDGIPGKNFDMDASEVG